MEEDSLLLLPGFRFHPTDEEIVIDYLSKKVADQSFSAIAVGEVDLNSCEPWDLPKKAKMGEKVWYFFCQKDRKYPTGTRTNRATETGYWKATGKDREIHRGGGTGTGTGRVLVGMKKTLVFYTGRAPRGEKTNWVMHEFRLEASSHFGSLPQTAMESWVVCRVFHKNEGIKKNSSMGMEPEAPVVGQQFNQIHNIPNQENPSYYFGSPNSFFTHEPGSAGSGYLHQQEATGRGFGAANGINAAGAIPSSSSSSATAAAAFIRQCKVEQVVSNSMAIRSRHETGMSSHCHTEISSCDAKDSSHAGPLFGLENIWDY